MIVSFNTRDLRDCCASLEKAEAAIGPEHAKELISLLADAEAAETAAELIEFHMPDVLVDGYTITLLIGTQYRTSFVRLIRDRKAGIEWSAVRRLKMMELSRC